MAAYGWRTGTPVSAGLFAEPYRFDFYQAVRHLERLRPDAPSVGTTSNPAFEAIRFQGPVGFGFPASDIQDLTAAAEPRAPVTLTVNFLGLAGGLGALPAPFGEQVAGQIRRHEHATARFLDIFNHRLISLTYRIQRMHRPTLGQAPPWQGPLAGYLLALSGLGTGGLQGRLTLRDRMLLPFTGILANPRRSPAGLRVMMAQIFGIPVRIGSFIGDWRRLDADTQTRIGASGQNNRLGRDVVLGTRVWDQAAGIEIRLGPMPLPLFRQFLPTGPAWAKVLDLVAFYADARVDLRIRLVLRRADIRPASLSRRAGSPLGWETRLLARPPAGDDDQTVFYVPLRQRPVAASPAHAA